MRRRAQSQVKKFKQILKKEKTRKMVRMSKRILKQIDKTQQNKNEVEAGIDDKMMEKHKQMHLKRS